MKSFITTSKVYLYLFILISLISPLFSQAQTDLKSNHEADENFKIEREKWFEQMHKCEEGINWRIIENENRQIKWQNRQSIIESKRTNKILVDDSTEIIANGLLKGQWIERGSNNLAGRVHTADIDFTNDIIYAASSGGNIWKGSVEGNNWKCLNNGTQFSNIRMIRVIKMMNTTRLIAVANNYVYYSDNEGTDWQTSTGLKNVNNSGNFKQSLIALDQSQTMYLLANEWDSNLGRNVRVIYRSRDYAKSFVPIIKLNLELQYCDIWTPKVADGNIYFIHRDTLSRIDPTGSINLVSLIKINQSWNQIGDIYLRGCKVGAKLTFYAFLKESAGNLFHIYSSNDGGYLWNLPGSIDFSPFEQNSIAVSTNNPDYIYLGDVELHRSYDGGKTFKTINNWYDYYNNIIETLHADIPGIIPLRDQTTGSEYTLIGTDGGLYISSDNINTVTNLSLKDLNVSQYYSVYTDKIKYNKVYIGSQDQGLQRCLLDSGKTLGFEQVISGDYGHLCSSDSGKSVWSVYPGFAHVYKDFDKQNTTRYSWDFQGTGGLWMPPIIDDPQNPDAAYLAGGGSNGTQNLWHLTLSGNNINAEKMPFDFNSSQISGELSAMEYSPLNKKLFYAATANGRFYSSTNSGVAWDSAMNFTGPYSHYFYGSSVKASFKTPGKVYLAGSGYSAHAIYESDDYGKTFSPIDSGLPNTLIYEISLSPDDEYIFAATEAGPYVYIAKSKKWFNMSGVNAPDQTYWTVEYIDKLKIARFGTYGRGIWDFKISPNAPSDIETNENLSGVKLIVNAYPNPSNDVIDINFNVPKETHGTIKIYDFEGKMINLIFDGNLNSGSNNFSWNGCTNEGFKLPSGNYIAIVNAYGIANYVKLNLIK